jgi:hypothetical protein
MTKSDRKAVRLAKAVGAEFREILADVPQNCVAAKLYPETLNFCECYLLAQAIKAHFPPASQFEVLADHATSFVSAKAIDADFVHKLAANPSGSGAKLVGPEGSMYLVIYRGDLFAVIAGSNEFIHAAIPYPDEIWDAYFEQFMWKYDAEFDVIRSEFEGWLKRRESQVR